MSKSRPIRKNPSHSSSLAFIAKAPNLDSHRRRGLPHPLARSSRLRTLRDPSLTLVLTEDGEDHILDGLLVLKGLRPLVELLVLLCVGEVLIHVCIVAQSSRGSRLRGKKLVVLSPYIARVYGRGAAPAILAG